MMEEVLLIFFSILGFLIAYHVWNKVHRKKQKLVCLRGEGCNKVTTSKYAKTFGIENTLMGMAYFILIFAIGILQLIFPEILTLSYVFWGKILVSGSSALFSIYLIGIQAFVLKDWCEYCLASSAISVLIFMTIII